MSCDPREFGLTADDLRAAANMLYASYNEGGGVDWGYPDAVRFGRVRSHLRALADAMDSEELAAYYDTDPGPAEPVEP